ncbi:MAG: carboxypeptidase-like regulatory domain-containing protein [Desulfovibrionales bacterium]|nr:carboxypeptidase-like regulatory domain-containing protein [Desulfovibrionales bacterium]
MSVDKDDYACSVALEDAGVDPSWVRARSGEIGDSDVKQWNTSPVLLPSDNSWVCPLPPRFFRSRECEGHLNCGDGSSDVAVCDKRGDCVMNGVCYSNMSGVAGYKGWSLARVWNDGVFNGEVSVEVSGSGFGVEFCEGGLWRGPVGGTLRGVVSNVSGNFLGGVSVSLVGEGVGVVSGLDGGYVLERVIPGNYSLVFEYPFYESGVVVGVVLRPFEESVEDFVLVRPLGSNCNDDCTDKQGVCRSECDGLGLCSFNSETKVACHGAVPGLIDYSGGRQVLCCTGEPFTPLKATVEYCEGLENVVSVRKPVLFRGKLVSMVVLVFDSDECKG